MKANILIAIIIISVTASFASVRHVPWCSGTHGAVGSSQCYGYATNRAYGRNYTDITCPANSVTTNYVPISYFTIVEENEYGITNYSDVEVGDLIEWSNHAAYVSLVLAPSPEYIKVDHKPGPNQGEVTDVTLQSVITGQMGGTAPIKIWRRADIFKFTVKNSFEDGDVKVGSTTYDSGSLIPNLRWESSRTLNAIEDSSYVYNGYLQRFDYWKLNGGFLSNDKIYSLIVDWKAGENPTIEAKFLNQFEIDLYNSFVNVNEPGQMKVEGQVYNNIENANPFPLVHGDDINFEAVDQTINGIDYHFDHWNDQNTYRSRTVTPTDNAQYTAFFIGKPEAVTGFTFTCDIGDPISFTWNEHENANVVYHIFRNVRTQYHQYDTELIATRSHSQTSFTDPLYSRASTYIYLIKYDVRAYYTSEETYADNNWHAAYGDIFFKNGTGDNPDENTIPENFAVSCFPYPFNPATNISLSLPGDGQSKMTVYNASGQKVQCLLNEYKSAGRYNVKWNGENENEAKVASGIYYLVVRNGNEQKTQKLILLQ